MRHAGGLSLSRLLICCESFVGTFGDLSDYVGIKGKSIIDPDTAEGKRVLRNWARYFAPITANYPFVRPDVEQATAAPGERRGA